MPIVGERQHPHRDTWTTVILGVAGSACGLGGAYALIARLPAAVAIGLFFFALIAFTLAALAPRLRGPLSISREGLKVTLDEYPAAPSVEAAEAGEIMTAEVGTSPSFVSAIEQMLAAPGTLSFAVIDLATGWLDTRLFAFAALLGRARGATSMVFVSGPGTYLGMADIRAVRWALSVGRTDLEAALIAALATTFQGWWPLIDQQMPPGGSFQQGPVPPANTQDVELKGQASIGSLTGAIKPAWLTGSILHGILRPFRISPAPPADPPPGWVRLKTEWVRRIGSGPPLSGWPTCNNCSGPRLSPRP